MTKILVVACAVSVLSASAVAQNLFGPDNFEGYADDTALDVVYDVIPSANTAAMSTAQANSGTKSVLVDELDSVAAGGAAAGNVLTASWTAATATGANPVVCDVYVHEPDATDTDPVQGLTFAAYAGGTFAGGTLENFVSLGSYFPTSATNYSRRIVYGGDGWQPTGVARTNGWHRFQVVVKAGVFETFIDGTAALAGTLTDPATGWNCLRLGGFSNAARINYHYDDLHVYQAAADVSEWHLY